MTDRLAEIEERSGDVLCGAIVYCLIGGYGEVDAQDDMNWLIGEVKRLKKTLKRIQEWDYINPPDPRSDGPWLKRLVDEALNS